jgi:hypothetical protein
MHNNLRFIHSAQVSTHHEPSRNKSTIVIILKFSLEWLILIHQSQKKNIHICSKISIFYYFGLKRTPITFLSGV